MRKFTNTIVNGLKKFVGVVDDFTSTKGFVIVLIILFGVCAYQKVEINHLQRENIVQANKVQNKRLEVGTKYKLDGLNMIVSEYTVKGHKNIVITTNLKNKQYYNVGANEDKEHRTKGVTIAYGYDQK